MGLTGGTALQFAPSFPELLDTLWSFAVAWLINYWWAVVIVGIIFYTRHYRIVARSTPGRDPPLAASFLAFNRSVEHLGDIATATSIRLFIFLGMAAAGFLWLLQAFGTFWYGLTGFEPVILGNLAAIGVSLAAGLGVADVRPWMVAAAFLGVVFIVVVIRIFQDMDAEDFG